MKKQAKKVVKQTMERTMDAMFNDHKGMREKMPMKNTGSPFSPTKNPRRTYQPKASWA